MDGNPNTIKTNELHFDRKNPRLSVFGFSEKTTDQEIMQVLWEAMDVRELVLSIAASGFFMHEPLIVSRETGQNIVIEGNRRLAAVRLLLEPQLASEFGDIPIIEEELRKKLEELPVIISTREEAWRYLGFKHVNGPSKWQSYAKSQYIADVHRKFNIPLDDIACQIGDTHKTVRRLYRGLMIIEQAEREKVFDRENRFRPHFSFSHLYTGLGYDGICSFLSVSPESDETSSPVPQKKLGELKDLCQWLFGNRREKIPPVIESQNPDLKRLNAVLKSREALSALRDGVTLVDAFEISRPSSTVFEESLMQAKRSLQKARGLLSTGYDGSEELLKIALDVAETAGDLYSEMERKRRPKFQKNFRMRDEDV
jgi:hypothetical protein